MRRVLFVDPDGDVLCAPSNMQLLGDDSQEYQDMVHAKTAKMFMEAVGKAIRKVDSHSTGHLSKIDLEKLSQILAGKDDKIVFVVGWHEDDSKESRIASWMRLLIDVEAKTDAIRLRLESRKERELEPFETDLKQLEVYQQLADAIRKVLTDSACIFNNDWDGYGCIIVDHCYVEKDILHDRAGNCLGHEVGPMVPHGKLKVYIHKDFSQEEECECGIFYIPNDDHSYFGIPYQGEFKA